MNLAQLSNRGTSELKGAAMKKLLSLVGLFLCSCGGVSIRQQPTDDRPAIPPITAQRLQECVKEYGNQLNAGSWAFSPEIRVDQDGRVLDVDAGGVPNTAPDLAACVRVTLGDMAIPSSIFNMRSMQSTSITEPTIEQRSLVGNPAVVVVVVVEVGEIVLESGAITILFATTVKVLDKAADDVLEAAKKWRRKPTKGRCLDAAEGGEYLWKALCQDMTGKQAAQCWEHINSNETEKRNMCNAWFLN